MGKIKVTKRRLEINTEVQIVTGMIVSDDYLRQIDPIYRPELMESNNCKLIADWCIDYYAKFNAAPKIHIQDIFENARQEEQLEDEQAEAIANILSHCSQQFEKADKINVEYLVAQTEDLFEKRHLLTHCEDVKRVAAQGTPDEAVEKFNDYQSVRRPKSTHVNPLIDKHALYQAFNTEHNILFKAPGALGELLPPFERDTYIGVMGPEKIGKTWFLQELAVWALRAHCNVAFFQIGDLSRDQQIRRFATRVAGRNYKKKYCGDILSPIPDCVLNQTGACTQEDCQGTNQNIFLDEKTKEKLLWEDAQNHVPCTYCRKRYPRQWRPGVWKTKIHTDVLEWDAAYELGMRLTQRIGGRELRLSCHPTDSISMRGIKNIILDWKTYDAWQPDLIVVDYMDIADAIDPRKSERDQINDTWKAGRALSQELNACVIGGTQADAESYGKESLTRQNFSNDKRKFSHVTSMITLQQTLQEKRDKCLRVGQLFIREDDYNESDKVVILQSLERGRPVIDSFFAK
jgi:hypothetical protein